MYPRQHIEEKQFFWGKIFNRFSHPFQTLKLNFLAEMSTCGQNFFVGLSKLHSNCPVGFSGKLSKKQTLCGFQTLTVFILSTERLRCDCQNCLLCIHVNILMKNNFLRECDSISLFFFLWDVKSKHFDKSTPLWPKIFRWVIRIAFYVSKRMCSKETIFLTTKIYSWILRALSWKVFDSFLGNFWWVFRNCFLRAQRMN